MRQDAAVLRSALRGRVIGPSDAGYDALRTTWKGADRHPALVADCHDVTDVRRVVAFAGESGMPLAVMGTGHDVAARSVPDDGLVLATRSLNGISVDADARQATVGPGVHWGELVAAAARHGLATTGASIATVGVAGFVLHGGLGWLMRSCGTGCDNILALDLVTADGRIRTVTADTEPDLYWAARGAGANFGVVTSLTLQLHAVPRITAGVIVYPAERARDVLQVYRQLTATAPDELVTHFYYMGNPDGSHSVGIGVCLAGSTAEADRVHAPLDSLGQPWRSSLRELDPVGLQAVHDSSTPPGGNYYVRAHYLPELTDERIHVLLEHCRRITAPLTKVFLEHLGGAVARIPSEATAFRGREATYSFLAVAGWTDPAEAPTHRAWTQDLSTAIAPLALDGAYVNYLDDDEDHRIPSAYGTGYARLVALKQRFDPTNVFCANRNIIPGRQHAATR